MSDGTAEKTAEGEGTPGVFQNATTAEHRLGNRIVGWTRFIAIIPTLGLAIGAVAMIVAASVGTFETVSAALSGDYSSKDILVSFITIADEYLLGIVMYIIALGVFELFVDDRLPLPAWLEFHHLDDLEEKLVAVVAVVLSVYFLGQVIKAPLGESLEIMRLGFGIGALIVAMGAFNYFMRKAQDHGKE
ncbi:MAG: YqhA family protein [Actinobacteria bacterium]|nr:MAG: YqhA family protein [Actinomycetota bacterium]